MPELTTCPSCGRHSLKAEKCCPHCGLCVRSGRAATVAMVGLALAASACTDKVGSSHELDYGVPAYGDTADTGDTGDSAD